MIGVDPGVNGGIAVLGRSGSAFYVEGFSPKMSEDEIMQILENAASRVHVVGSNICYMEKVGFMRGDGGKGAFIFGQIYGLLRGGLLARGIRIHNVYPAIWQSRMNCLTGGNKNVSKRRALELFPGEKVTHAVADALLIAEFGRRVEAGLPFS